MTGFVSARPWPLHNPLPAMVNNDILGQFESLFQEREHAINGQAGTAWFDYQRQSFARLQTVNFPDRRQEDWKYTPIQRLLGTEVLRPAAPDATLDLSPMPGHDAHILHIRNGFADLHALPKELHAAGVRVSHWRDVFNTPSWQDTFSPVLPDDTTDTSRAFDLLNAAFHLSAICIEIPENTILTKPIEVRMVHQAAKASMSNPLYFVRVGRNSEVTWIERFERAHGYADTPESLINSAGYFHLSANASLTHVRWQDLPPQQRLVWKMAVRQERDSRLVSQLFDLGGQVVRNTIDVDLTASNTYTSLEGAYIAAGQQSVTHQTRINHRVPHGESHEWYKGLLDDRASAAFNGKVYVHPDAQKTNAFQQNDALVLSPHALMNSKPQLEIFADDVRCSHGATIGQLDAQALFYLRARGIAKDTARQMLKSAFLAPLVEHLPNEALRAYIGPKMGILA